MTGYVLRRYRSLFHWSGRLGVINPVTVDLMSLTSKMVGSTPCAAVRHKDDNGQAISLAQFVCVGMVAGSSLQRMTNGTRNAKVVTLLLPTVALDHLQASLSVCFDKWDDTLCSQITEKGLEFGTRRKHYHIVFVSLFLYLFLFFPF